MFGSGAPSLVQVGSRSLAFFVCLFVCVCIRSPAMYVFCLMLSITSSIPIHANCLLLVWAIRACGMVIHVSVSAVSDQDSDCIPLLCLCIGSLLCCSHVPSSVSRILYGSLFTTVRLPLVSLPVCVFRVGFHVSPLGPRNDIEVDTATSMWSLYGLQGAIMCGSNGCGCPYWRFRRMG
jgi:hypothetical protein